MSIIVEDRFQEYIQEKFDVNTLVMLNEIIFYGIFVYYYYFGPIQNSEQNFAILKFIGIIFALRYLFNYITKYTIKGKEDDTSYFQLNGKIAIFTILILFLSLEHSNIYTTIAIIISYALLSSGAKYGYTIDNLLTVGIIYALFCSKIV